MPVGHPAALDFLLTRRSCPVKALTTPVPDAQALGNILTAAARTPDHGKLEPWRFIVLHDAALQRLAKRVKIRAAELNLDTAKLEKSYRQFADASLVVAVVASPKPSEKIPEIEQILSAGAVCLSLLNAALASGWGANWLTGWMAMDQDFLEGLSLSKTEFIAGFIHIGTAPNTPPERPRPDISAITKWVST